MKAAAPAAAIRVRQAGPDDAAAIVRVGSESPGASPWSASQYADAARGNYQGWIAEHNGDVVGFIFARIAADEVEILNLAVLPDRRRLGIASQLIERALDHAKASGAARAYLEVRASNAAAISLYGKCGFALAGRRTRYYSSPVEDALSLSRTLP
jgi:ribosomal-protein-alanine N-acetyltransferase